ncbi:RNA-binding domain-containing protein [Schizophyllum fasciatum]
MFIGGLNWDTTDDTLRAYFEQFGKVDACTIMRDAAGRSRCFAFLTFEDPASVNAVMVKEHTLDGKIIDPKRAIPRQEHQRATKLFIGGLPGSVTSESMRAFFSQFGKVIDSTVMLDRETGRSKGFGFISFEDTDVQPFLGFGNLAIDGKLIDVKLAQPRHQREQMQEETGGGAYYARGPNAMPNAMGGLQAGFGGVPQQQQPQQPFDAQTLANLYTRMLSQISPITMGGGMAGAGGMGMGMPGAGMGAMGGAGMGMGGSAGMGGGMGAGGGMGGGGMGRGGMGRGGGHSMAGVPRGPRNMGGGPGVGPQRQQRGQHNFHPYAR